MKIDLFLTNISFNKTNLENKVVVVIDVLRSSTSICAALKANAKGVIPVAGPGEAGDLWNKLGNSAILAGEQGGVKIENFQLGNSPLEFTPETVGDKFVIMTTTNGTEPFVKAAKASAVLSCGMVNISEVAQKINETDKDVIIICSGKEGQFSIEDTLCGGLLENLLIKEFQRDLKLNDAGNLALLLYNNNKDIIRQTIEQSEHGRYLQSIGFAEDIDIACQMNSIPVLPILKDGRLVLQK
ncbi:MAG: hypothetical protein DRP35_00280 [Candidatus Zixiibacteriota bacterium]|nr:MAG: hypothetical protein DRP35_00280 [candidate division Zixibacteria bacterium]